jgi:hypothetical protein
MKGAKPMWMNRWDIQFAVERNSPATVKGRAARFLAAFMEEVDNNSDGWAYWPLPGRAAEKLQDMIQSENPMTEADYRKALVPIKSFYTRRGYKAGMQYPEAA